MEKTFLRIQGKRGGYEPVANLMVKMWINRIPFVQVNSNVNSGSKNTINRWDRGKDLLYVLVRKEDVALIKLMNTECAIVDAPDFRWRKWRSER